MAMESSINSLKLRLEHIAAAAQKIRSSAHFALCKTGREPLTTRTVPTPAIPSLLLPIPEGIISLLVNSGCPFEAAGPLSDAFIRSVHKLRDIYQTTHQQTCERLAKNHLSDPARLAHQFNKLGSSLEAQYQQRIIAARQLSIDQVRKMSHSLPPKRAFNQESVPLLETYFEYNAYPSAPDKAALARKSMMTPRQIEVWFQNHRNRAKKEGRTLRRLTSDPLPLQLSLESLEKKMPFFVIPEHERKDPAQLLAMDPASDSEEEDTRPSSIPDINVAFSNFTPPHAFPTTYPPSSDHNPFPCNHKQRTLPSPVWMRKPAISLPNRTTVDFEDFISNFAAKLVLRESSSNQNNRRRKSPFINTAICPWFASTHTTVSSAPHPALVRSSAFMRTVETADALPIVPAPSSRLHPFRSPSPTSQHVTLVPDMSGDNSARRKVARLPKRAPRHIVAHCGRSHDMSEASRMLSLSSSTLFSSSGSTSSSSDASSDGRPSSSSGHSSDSSSPATPESSSTQLPTGDNFPHASISGLVLEHEYDDVSASFLQLHHDLHAGK